MLPNHSLDGLLLPKIYQIRDNLFVAKFELMKLLPAYYVVKNALQAGKINPDRPIVETSSGTFALALARVCKALALPFHIIGDTAIDSVLQQKLIAHGGTVQLLSEAITKDQPQQHRLAALADFMAKTPGAFWTQQYDHPGHPEAYQLFADYLHDQFDGALTLVAATGSGGSSCGTIMALRDYCPSHRLVGVDTFGSVLFGLTNGPRVLRGLGNTIQPKNLNHRCFDQVHWVRANEAYGAALSLYHDHALFCGPTTGATYQVAQWIAARNPNERVVFIAADTGERYQKTLYSANWRHASGLTLRAATSPEKIDHPDDIVAPWSYMNWRRQSLSSVMCAEENAIVR